MDISFDPDKDQELRKRRGIGFEEVAEVFSHPYYLEPNDEPYDGQWKAIGYVGSKLWTLVFDDCFDELGELRWLATFWPAEKDEQERFFTCQKEK